MVSKTLLLLLLKLARVTSNCTTTFYCGSSCLGGATRGDESREMATSGRGKPTPAKPVDGVQLSLMEPGERAEFISSRRGACLRTNKGCLACAKTRHASNPGRSCGDRGSVDEAGREVGEV